MQTIGQFLKQGRRKSKKSFTQITRETKISKAVLEALEADDFTKLPPDPFVKGFICNYAQALNLDSDKALAIFRRDFTTTKSGKILPRGLTKPLDEPSSWGRRLIILFLVSLISGLFIFYVGWQLKIFFEPPKLTITQPKPNVVLKGPIIEVKGWASANSTVWVNDQLAEVLPNGEFKVNVSLLSGKNDLIIKVKNRQGKVTEEKLTVEVLDK